MCYDTTMFVVKLSIMFCLKSKKNSFYLQTGGQSCLYQSNYFQFITTWAKVKLNAEVS